LLLLDSSKEDRTGSGGVGVVRNIRRGGATALAAVLMVRGTAATDRSVHEIQITASRYAFDPVTIQVNAGEPVRIMVRSTDGVHGFSIPKLKMNGKGNQRCSVCDSATQAFRPQGRGRGGGRRVKK